MTQYETLMQIHAKQVSIISIDMLRFDISFPLVEAKLKLKII